VLEQLLKALPEAKYTSSLPNELHEVSALITQQNEAACHRLAHNE
jgi:hypothetical protein